MTGLGAVPRGAVDTGPDGPPAVGSVQRSAAVREVGRDAGAAEDVGDDDVRGPGRGFAVRGPDAGWKCRWSEPGSSASPESSV